MKNFRRYLLLMILLYVLHLFYSSMLNFSEAETFDAPNLPFFSNKQFEQSNLIIETFGREGCPYCLILKDNLYSSLFSSDSKTSDITARYYNIKNEQVDRYFEDSITKFNLPEDLQGAVPATIINGTYLILGYSEDSTSFYLDLIDQISRGESIKANPDQYLFTSQEASEDDQPSYYSTSSTLLSLNLALCTLSLLLTLCYIKKDDVINDTSSFFVWIA